MQLAFNIETRIERGYLLSEEDSKKVMDKAFELAKERQYNIDDNPNYLSFYVEYAIQLLLNSDEIAGILTDKISEKELTSAWIEKN